MRRSIEDPRLEARRDQRSKRLRQIDCKSNPETCAPASSTDRNFTAHRISPRLGGLDDVMTDGELDNFATRFGLGANFVTSLGEVVDKHSLKSSVVKMAARSFGRRCNDDSSVAKLAYVRAFCEEGCDLDFTLPWTLRPIGGLIIGAIKWRLRPVPLGLRGYALLGGERRRNQ